MLGLTPRSNGSLRDDFNGIKTVWVNGHKFKIRKVNPFLDFEADTMPQIFSFYIKRRKPAEPADLSFEQIVKSLTDMKRMVSAGVVWPKLCPEILTIDDIFRWGDTGPKLYLEIIAHSLNQFRGLRGVFFSIKTRLWLYMQWRKATAKLQSIYSFQTEVIP